MLYAIVAVIALIADQAVKYWTTAHIVLNEGKHKLIPGFIHLTNVHNTGAAFSFLEGARWFFVVLCALFVVALIYLLAKNIIKSKSARWMAVMVMAGAVGNCIDRIISGYVVDMFEFEFKIFGRQFPVFNVADIFITLCGIAFCVCILLEKPEDERARKARAAAGTGAGIKPRQPAVDEDSVPGRVGRRGAAGNDPFAEWERYAASKNAEGQDAVSKSSVPQSHKAGRGTASTLDEPMSHVRPAPKPQQSRPAAARPAQPGPAAPAQEQPPKPAAKPDTDFDNVSFDLDDILAEFRDL